MIKQRTVKKSSKKAHQECSRSAAQQYRESRRWEGKRKKRFSGDMKLNYYIWSACIFNEPYLRPQGSNFVDEVVGNRGNKDDDAMDNRKRLTKITQVLIEV